LSGYLFGFSSYVVAHEYGGHANLGVFLLPLAALVVPRFLREELRARGLAWRLGAILAFQLTISTELALTLTLAARPQLFAQHLYRRCISPGETLAVFPYARSGDSMLWQAESDFWFKTAEGNLRIDTYPPRFVFADPTEVALQFHWYGPGPRPTMQELRLFAKRRSVDRIVSVEADGYPNGTEMHAFGPVQAIGGVFVAPTCGYVSLAGDTRGIPGR
jgi:hypothetical protein